MSHFKRHKKDDDKVVKAERKGLILSLLSTSIPKHKTYIFLVLDKAQSEINETLFGEKQKHSHKIEE